MWDTALVVLDVLFQQLGGGFLFLRETRIDPTNQNVSVDQLSRAGKDLLASNLAGLAYLVPGISCFAPRCLFRASANNRSFSLIGSSDLLRPITIRMQSIPDSKWISLPGVELLCRSGIIL
jgi:hypothetical protein